MNQHTQLGHSHWRDLVGAFRSLLTLGLRRRRTRRHLRHLNARLLRDIGIDEQARARECGQWFWQGLPDVARPTASPNENAPGFRGRAQFSES